MRTVAILDDYGFGSGRIGLFGKELYVELLARLNEEALRNKVLRITLSNQRNDDRSIVIKSSAAPLIKVFRDTELRWKLGYVLRDNHVDLLHVNVLNARYPGNVVAVARALGIPMVTTVHSYNPVCPTGWGTKLPEEVVCSDLGLQRHCIRCLLSQPTTERAPGPRGLLDGGNQFFALRSLLRSSRAVITPSSHLSAEVSAGVGIKKVRTLFNPLPDAVLAAEPSFGGERAVVFSGRLTREKGAHVLPLLADLENDVVFHVMGAGPLAGLIKEASTKRANLVFHGYVSNEEKASIARSCRAVLAPCYWFEAFGYTVAEAFALGKPVVGFALGGVAELVERSGAGILVEPFDLHRMAEEIGRLAGDDGLSRVLGAKGRRFATSQLAPSFYAERIQEVYDFASEEQVSGRHAG